MPLPSRFAKVCITYLGDLLVKLIDGLVCLLPHLLASLVKRCSGVLAVLLELVIDLRCLVLRVAGELVYLAADLRAGCLGLLLCLLATAWEVVLDFVGELSGIG